MEGGGSSSIKTKLSLDQSLSLVVQGIRCVEFCLWTSQLEPSLQYLTMPLHHKSLCVYVFDARSHQLKITQW